MPRIHYITKEDTQRLKNQIVEYKTYIRKQSSIARMAKADELYMNANKELDKLVNNLDSLGESLDKTDFDKVMSGLQSLDGTLIKFKAAVSGMEAPANQEEQAEPNAQPVERPEQMMTQKLEELSYIVRTQKANYERIDRLEQRNADENLSEDLKRLDEANARTLIKGSQDKLRNVASRSVSGYGVLYDTVSECIKIIDADNDLITLAGSEYRAFKNIFESWKQSVETMVKNGEYASEDTEDAVIKLYEHANDFFEGTKGYTQAFDELRSLVRRECASMSAALSRQEGILYKDLLTHNYPAPPRNTVRERIEREAVSSDIDEILPPPSYFTKGAEQYKNMLEIQQFANRIMINEPYVHNGQTLQGEALRSELKKYEVFSFSEINRKGNESTPLLASLYNKGITEEQLLRAAKNPDDPENAAVINLMRETRKEILDIAMTDDVKAADEKISDLIVTTLGRLEKEIEELIKNPTNENITAFAISKVNLKSFLEQGIPKNVYKEDGSQFIRDSVDRKLKAAGKAYTFEQIYGIASTFSHVGPRYQAVREDGSISLDGANVIANQTFLIRNFLNKMSKKPTTGEAIKLFDEDYNLRVGGFETGENFLHEDNYYAENKGVMKDTLYKLGVYNVDTFMKVMEIQRDLHGASKRFQKIFDALQVIQTAEQRGYKQEYINHYYNQLERYCNEYLDHRNPWTKDGEDRYKLVTRIAAFADASRAHRLEVAQEERVQDRERDISHREVHNNFLAKTDSIFGDSDQMKAIKKISEKIEFNQLHGMDIPADGGEVNWFKLIKVCADYLADPSKRDNARRAAVRELMGKAIEAGHFNDEHLNRAFEQSAPGVEGGREQVALAIRDYEAASRARVEALSAERAQAAQQTERKIREINDRIEKNADINRMYVANENDIYLDSIFGLNPVHNERMKKEDVYGLGNGKIYQADEIELSDQAKKGLEELGLTEKDFGVLAYMDYSLNSYIVDGQKHTKKSDEAAEVISGMIHGNVTGYKFREKILGALSVDGNAFKAARANANAMLEKIGAGNPPDIKEMAELMGGMLKFLKPEPRTTYVDGYVAEQFFIKRMMKMTEANPKLMPAVLASRTISTKDYAMMRGIAANADYEMDASLARIKVASAIKSGYAMSKQEMKDCYRAILKAGVTWTESKSVATLYEMNNAAKVKKITQEFNEATSEYKRIKRQYEAALEGGKKPEELTDLKAKMAGVKKNMDDISASMIVQDNAKNEPRSILTFVGSAKGREMYDSLIESLIPEEITLEDLYEKSNNGHVFKNEYEVIHSELIDQLQELKDKNKPDKVKENEKEKERQEVVEVPKQAEEQKGAVKHV